MLKYSLKFESIWDWYLFFIDPLTPQMYVLDTCENVNIVEQPIMMKIDILLVSDYMYNVIIARMSD